MSVAETANTSVTVYNSTTQNQWGDVIDDNTPSLEHIPATLIETGKTIQEPNSPTPRTIRQISCWVPFWSGVTDSSRILDETTGDIYIVVGVTRPPTIIGAPVDLRLDLKRVSAQTT